MYKQYIVRSDIMKVIVIGSGIVGASTAYYLARQDVSVTLIDQQHTGYAKGAGAGIVCPWISRIDNEKWYEIAKAGALYYEVLVDQLDDDGEKDYGYKKVGAISVSSNVDELDEIENNLHVKRRETPEIGEIKRLNAEQVREKFPLLNENLAGVYVSNAARVDAKNLSESMKNAAIKRGVKLIKGRAELTEKDGAVTGVKVNNKSINADSIVIAAGAWTPELLKPLGMTLKVEPQRGQIVHMKLRETDTSKWPVILPQGSHYMLAFDDSRIVAGATREDGVGFDYRLTAGGVQNVLSEALKVAPGLDQGTLHEVRIGFRPMSPDNLPIIGGINHVSGVVLVTGLGASGITMGAYVGKLAGKIALGKKITQHDMSVYHPDRTLTT